MVAAVFRTIFAQPNADAVSEAWDQVRDQLAVMFPKVGPLMDDAKTEVLAFTGSRGRTGRRSGRPTRSSGSTKRPSVADAPGVPGDDVEAPVDFVVADSVVAEELDA
jgi:putative transposase